MRDIACCIWALPDDDTSRMSRSADLGFQTIDVRPGTLGDEAAWLRATDLGLTLSCVAVSAELPEEVSLDSEQTAVEAFGVMETWLEQASGRGARTAYVVPGKSVDDISRYGSRLSRLGDKAGECGIRLCVEHFPGTCLPTASETLAFLSRLDHPNLFLLVDSGHLSMSSEDPASVLRQAGERLGYVHLDDNDAINDQHLALGDGVITPGLLQDLFSAMDEIGSDAGVSLELNAQLPDPKDALTRSLRLLHSLED